jgi:ABC-type transport system involved in multi-copper enzyme maturation permease subunit
LLWYKAWLETRTRFGASLLALTLFCGLFVHHALELMRPEWRSGFQRLLYIMQEFIAILWILSVLLVAMGGVVHEKAIGTSSLTLSLPVSRGRLHRTRVGVGLLEAVVLGVVPWLTIFMVSVHANMPVLLTQIGFYVALLVSGGLVYYAMGILVSSLIEGAYTATAVAIGLAFLSVTVEDVWFKQWSLWRFLTGNFCIDPHTFLLSAHFPWLGTLACLFATALMLFTSTKVIQRRDF